MNLSDETTLKHIPDEWKQAWSEKTVEELMRMADHLRQHLQNIQEENSLETLGHILKCLEAYLEVRIEKSDTNLDVIL